MHRPLWQTFLCLFVLAFVARSGAMGLLALSAANDPPLALLAAYGLEVAAGLAVVVGLWLAQRWVIAAVVVLGAVVGATALLEAFVLGVSPPLAAIGRIAVAALATAGLAWILARELGPSGTARGKEGAASR